MCERAGRRCAGHAGSALREALVRYRAACPGGPSPCVLLETESRIGRLHAHVAVASSWLRDAETPGERAEAQAYLEQARAKLKARWAEGAAAARAAALTADEQLRWDAAEHDRRHAEERQAVCEAMADARVGIDDSAADRYNRLAAHHRDAAAEYAATQQQIMAGARARRSAPAAAAPAPARVELSDELKTRIATYSQWNRPETLITGDQAAALVGEGAAGRLPVALEAGRGHPDMHRFGDIAALAGDDLPAPARSTRRALQEHTQWRRSGEAAQVAAFRELEARKNREATLAA